MSETTKTDLRLLAYADVDETNAAHRLVLATSELDDDVAEVLTHVQNDLFDVGADFCTPVVENPEYPPLRIEADYVERLEGWCDQYNEQLAEAALVHPQRRHVAAAHLHVARTVVPTRGALRLGGARAVRRRDERARDQVPQPALGPAVHPGPLREPGGRRRALGARAASAPTASPAQRRRLTGSPRRGTARARGPGLEPGLQPGERARAHRQLDLAARGASTSRRRGRRRARTPRHARAALARRRSGRCGARTSFGRAAGRRSGTTRGSPRGSGPARAPSPCRRAGWRHGR